jgi:hypothetical protein
MAARIKQQQRAAKLAEEGVVFPPALLAEETARLQGEGARCGGATECGMRKR